MRPLRLLFLVLFVLALLPAAPAMAVTIPVNTTSNSPDPNPTDGNCDTGAGAPSGQCSLRAAIQTANNTPSVADTITVPAGLYTLAGSGGDDTAAAGDLDITTPITIDGAGAGQTIIDGADIDRIFHVTAATPANATIQEVTIRNGNNPSTSNAGGGIYNERSLTLRDSEVIDSANSAGNGGGIANGVSGVLTVDRSLIAGNDAANGGGIYNGGGSLTLVSSTVSGNFGASFGGGVYNASGTSPSLAISSSTITNNNSADGAGYLNNSTNPSRSITNSIIAGNTGSSECSGDGTPFATTSYSIDTGTSCGFLNVAQGDRPNTGPVLGALANNGGPTRTHLPGSGSPAIDGGPATGCPPADQRGVARPAAAACDIGAVETQPAPPPPPPPANDPSSITLDIEQVTRTPGDANTVNATIKRKDGSPGAGVEARFVVSGANPLSGLIKGDNNGVASNGWQGIHDGADIYTVWLDLNGNAALDPGEPNDSATVNWVLPTPEVAKTVNVEPVSGIVLVKLPKNAKLAKRDAWAQAAQASYVPLKEAKNVPIGSILDTRKGTVELTSSASTAKPGLTQTAQFYSGAFQIRQVRAAHPVTELRMSESLTCPKGNSKVVPARARTRKLWGKGKGRFRTRGRHSSASVRGTTWYSKDDCKKTTTVVREGSVIVQDFGKKKNIRLTADGTNRYVARPVKRR